MQNTPEISGSVPFFCGEYFPTLDQKKRLTIPARWRSDALTEVYIIRNKRGGLTGMTREVLEQVAEEAKMEASSTADYQVFKKWLFAKATISPVDAQGRLILTDDLCKHAGLEKEVALVGSRDRFEICSPENHQRAEKDESAIFESLAARMGL